MNVVLSLHVTRLQHAQTHKDLLHANVTLVLLEMEQHVQVHKKVFVKKSKKVSTVKLIEDYYHQHNKYIDLMNHKRHMVYIFIYIYKPISVCNKKA